VFDPDSRYVSAPTYTVTDHRGRTVEVVAVPDHPSAALLGVHLRHQGERLDHLAYRYLSDAATWWRIAELNEAMLADALAEVLEIRIPRGPA
jgi:hypothetical protein